MTSDPDSWWLDERAHAGREHRRPREVLGFDVDADYSASGMDARYLCKKR